MKCKSTHLCFNEDALEGVEWERRRIERRKRGRDEVRIGEWNILKMVESILREVEILLREVESFLGREVVVVEVVEVVVEVVGKGTMG